jgi:outer membrane biosynthesis protein TonB
MMDYVYNEIELIDEKENKRKGFLFSVILHVIILLICLLPLLVGREIPPLDNQTGILVAFGVPDGGNNSNQEKPAPVAEKKEAAKPTPAKPKTTEVKKKETKAKKSEASTKVSTAKVVDKVEDNDVKAVEAEKAEMVKKQAIAEAAKKAKAEADAKAKAEADAKAKAKAEKEAAAAAKAKKEAEEKAKFSNAKSKFSDLFSGGGSAGDNNSDQAKGDTKGDPNAKALEGISTGSGRVGGGLGGRGILYEPKIKDNSQKAGKVVVKVCVNKSGKVISSKFTQKGSTTTDAHLVKIAKESAVKYKFSASEIEEQCGTITVDFKLN